MSTFSLVVLPDPGSPLRADLVAALLATSTPLLDLADVATGPAPLASSICAAIREARLAHPLLIVATAAGLPLLPAVARAQRAAHHLICGYVLLDIGARALEADPTGESWPDAPVTLVTPATAGIPNDADADADADADVDAESVAKHARLRGWTVRAGGQPEALASALLALAADLTP